MKRDVRHHGVKGPAAACNCKNIDPRESIKPTFIPPSCALGRPLSPFHAARPWRSTPGCSHALLRHPRCAPPLPATRAARRRCRPPPPPKKRVLLREEPVKPLSQGVFLYIVFRMSYRGEGRRCLARLPAEEEGGSPVPWGWTRSPLRGTEDPRPIYSPTPSIPARPWAAWGRVAEGGSSHLPSPSTPKPGRGPVCKPTRPPTPRVFAGGGGGELPPAQPHATHQGPRLPRSSARGGTDTHTKRAKKSKKSIFIFLFSVSGAVPVARPPPPSLCFTAPLQKR